MEMAKSLSIQDIYIIVTGIVMGTLARVMTLKIDNRQIPSYPSAYFNNIILGFIASSLGAIAIPAILVKDYTAVTFLTVAVTQFREIRSTERDSLGKLEHTEYIRRGEAYIDGIAKSFESRNYISLLASLVTVLSMELTIKYGTFINVLCGATAGIIIIYFCYRFTKGKNIGYICDISLGKIEVRESELYVDNMFVTNYLGADRSRTMFMKEGIAVVLSPVGEASRVTLENYGQRQAILFEAVRALGVKRYKFMRRNFSSGKFIIAFVPIIRDNELLIKAIANTPILENSRKVKRIMKM